MVDKRNRRLVENTGAFPLVPMGSPPNAKGLGMRGVVVRYRILRRETPEARKRRETEEFIAYRERRREALRVVMPARSRGI